MSFNFMAAVTICSDFGAPQNKICYCFQEVTVLELHSILPKLLTLSQIQTRWFLITDSVPPSHDFHIGNMKSHAIISKTVADIHT